MMPRTEQYCGGSADPRKNIDCKFFYYSQCSLGDRCLFRHEPAALGSRIVCFHWKQGRCNKAHCQFRHMELENNTIPCYWEKLNGRCHIEECPFQHSLNSKDVIGLMKEDNYRGLFELLQKIETAEKKLEGARENRPHTMVGEPPHNLASNNMANEFNDCKFYYYATCVKGNRCDFRHDPTSLGSQGICVDWRMGKCTRRRCKYRHMILVGNPTFCCWETESVGCKVENCPFQHIYSKKNFQESVTDDSENSSLMGDVKVEDTSSGVRRKNRRPKIRSTSKHRSNKSQEERDEQESRNASSKSESLSVHSLGKLLQEQEKTDQKSEEKAEATEGMSIHFLAQLQQKLLDAEKKLEEKHVLDVETIKQEQEQLTAKKLEEMKAEMEKKMLKEFECQICFELFISAVTLNCSHSFCQFCITEWRKYDRNCPVCHTIIISETKALTIDNYIEDMIPNLSEVLRTKREDALQQRRHVSALQF